MLAVVRDVRKKGAGGGVAALQTQIEEIRAAGAAALAELDRLQAERAEAEDYQRVVAIDEDMRRAQFGIDHAAHKLRGLEAELAAAKAAEQAAALARHKKILIELWPRLRRAVIAAGQIQAEAILARQAATAELGEHQATLQLPVIGYSGLLIDPYIGLWASENDRVFAALERKPKPAPPAPVPAPAKAAPPKHPIAAPPAPRPLRPLRRDPPPADGQVSVTMLRAGVELGDDRGPSVVGDEISISTEQGRLLVLRGCADYVQQKRADG